MTQRSLLSFFSTQSGQSESVGSHLVEGVRELGEDTDSAPSSPLVTVIDSTVEPAGVNFANNGAGADLFPTDLGLTENHIPSQPVLQNYPLTSFSGKKRCFNSGWYSSYSWLEYSVDKDPCYCYPCRFFSLSEAASSNAKDTFTKVGFRDWKHATGKGGILRVHDKCASHRHAMEAWVQYKLNTAKSSTIVNHMESNRSSVIKMNRHYLETVIQVLLLCAHQEIALKGHRESVESENRGNFLEILHVVGAHDSLVEQRLFSGPRNAIYTSAEIQNTLLNIMGEMVRRRICSYVRDAGVYSIMADETKDVSRVEQMAIVVRYVSIADACIHERFLTFVELSQFDAESLTEHILLTLKHYHLDLDNLVSQGYDGASVMSGKFSGVQQRVMQMAPQAIYIHCFAHILNLVLVDSTKNVKSTAEFFALLESLYVFISHAKAHAIFISQQNKLHHNKQKRELQRLSDTRWACRYLTVNTFCHTFDAVLATLQEISEGENPVKAVEAKGFLAQIKSFSFLLHLVIFERVLSCTKSLSDLLQHEHCDLVTAVNLISSTIETLKEFRSDSSWDHLYSYSEQVAKLNQIPLPDDPTTEPPTKRQRKIPRRYDDSFVLESVGSREDVSSSDSYKLAFYFPVLDSFIQELNRRFTSRNMEIMKSIQACHPSSEYFLDPDSLVHLTTHYNLDHSMLAMECKLAKRSLASKQDEMQSISDVLKNLYPLKEAFPTLVKVIQISLTICVSSAQCERSFSALKRIKTYLRSTMKEQRLVDLASLSIERDISKHLDINEIIDSFASKNRRITLI